MAPSVAPFTDDQMAELLQGGGQPVQKPPSGGLTDDEMAALMKGEAKAEPKIEEKGKSTASRSDAYLKGLGFAQGWTPKGEHYDAFEPFIKGSAKKHEVPEQLVKGVVWKESNFNPDIAYGRKKAGSSGDAGAMQLIPATAKAMGVVDVYSPAQNIEGGTKYLKSLYDKFGNWGKAVASYNSGAANRFFSANPNAKLEDAPNYKNYVKPVLEAANKFGAGIQTEYTEDRTPMVDEYGRQIGVDEVAGPRDITKALGRETFRAAGMTGGSIVGGGSGALAGTAVAGPGPGTAAGAMTGRTAGSGVGYELGDIAYDLITGEPHEWEKSGEHIQTGMAYGLGGELLNEAVINPAFKYAKKGYDKLKGVFTGKTAQIRAGEALSKVEGGLSEQELANRERAQKLEEKLGVQLTPAQRTGNVEQAMLEQGAATDPKVAQFLSQLESNARNEAQGRFLATLSKPKPLPGGQSAEVTGEVMHKTLQTGLKNVQKIENQVWSGLEDYPIPFENGNAAIREVKSIPLDEETRNAVDSAVKFIDSTPKTTKGLRAIEETLNSDITSAYKAGKSKVANRLRVIRDGLRTDYDAMGAAAQSGDIALHEGELVYPSKVQGQIEKIDREIAGEAAKKPVPDMQAVESALREKGVPTMRQVGEDEAAHTKRLVKDYRKAIGKDVPTKPGANDALVNKLTTDKAQLQDKLANLEPAQDIGEKIAEAKKFSKEQKFDRFQKGVTKKVLAFGDEYGGQKIPYEKIPQMYANSWGWKDLVRATGSEARARELMKPYVVDDLIAKATNSQGNFTTSKALDYLKAKRVFLKNSGLDSEVKEIIKGQFPEEINRTLAVKRADKLTEKPYFTLQEAKSMLQRYGSTMRELYGKESVEALRDYHNLMQALSRNKNVAYSGGPTTAEKLISSQAPIMTAGERIRQRIGDAIATAIGIGTGGAIHGTAGAMIGGVAVAGGKAVMEGMSESVAQKTSQFMRDAMFDPRKAEGLMEIARTARVEDAERKAQELVKPYMLSLGLMGAGKELGSK